MNNPYRPPNASVSAAPEMVVKRKRPFLIWLTQALVIIFILLLTAALGTGIFSFIKAPSPAPVLGFILACIPTLLVAVPLAMLFMGLARSKRWAWHGSILFAILLLIFTLYSRAHPAPDVLPIADNELFGAAIAELLITFLLVLYPFRLYFSKSVRAFFTHRPAAERLNSGVRPHEIVTSSED